MKKQVLAAGMLTAIMSNNAIAVGELRGDVDVSLEIGQGCAINGQASAGVNKFGSVDFGQHSNLELYIDAESIDSNGAGGSVTLNCNNLLGYSIALDDGLHTAEPGTRRVAQGSEYVSYDLYQDSARSVRWGSSGEAMTLQGSGSEQPLVIYGRVVNGQSTPTAGLYTDTVRMTVSW